MIDHVLTVTVALAVPLALGYALLQLLAPRSPLWWFERPAFSFLLGAGGASLAWMLLVPIHGVIQPRWALLVVACGALMLARDFTLHVRTSIGRLLMPLAPTALIFTVHQLWSST